MELKTGDILYVVVSNITEVKREENLPNEKSLFEISEVEITHCTRSFSIGFLKSNNKKVRVEHLNIDNDQKEITQYSVVGVYSNFVKAEEAAIGFIHLNREVAIRNIDYFKKNISDLENLSEDILERDNIEYLESLMSEADKRNSKRGVIGYEKMNIAISIHNVIGNHNVKEKNPFLIDINPIYCYEENNPNLYCFCDYTGEVLLTDSPTNTPILKNSFKSNNGYINNIETYKTITEVSFVEEDNSNIKRIAPFLKKELLMAINEHINSLALAVLKEQKYLDKLNTDNYYGELILLT